MTQNLTQNRKNADGISGGNRTEKDIFPDTIRLESAENVYSLCLSAAHNPEVAGSSPAAATKETAGFNKKSAGSLTFFVYMIFQRLE